MARTPDFEDDEDVFVEFYKNIGQRIKTVREQRGFSRRQLTDAADIKPAYGYLIEGEGQNITLKTLLRIAVALGVSPRELMPGSQKPGDAEDENRAMREQLKQYLDMIEGAEPFQKALRKMVDKSTPSKRP